MGYADSLWSRRQGWDQKIQGTIRTGPTQWIRRRPNQARLICFYFFLKLEEGRGAKPMPVRNLQSSSHIQTKLTKSFIERKIRCVFTEDVYFINHALIISLVQISMKRFTERFRKRFTLYVIRYFLPYTGSCICDMVVRS